MARGLGGVFCALSLSFHAGFLLGVMMIDPFYIHLYSNEFGVFSLLFVLAQWASLSRHTGASDLAVVTCW